MNEMAFFLGSFVCALEKVSEYEWDKLEAAGFTPEDRAQLTLLVRKLANTLYEVA